MDDAVTIEAPVSEAGADATEAASDAAVEIAQIEADRDVTIAETHAETAVELAEIEQDEVDDLEWLDNRLSVYEASHVSRLDALDLKLATVQEQNNRLETMLTALLILIPSQAEPTPAEATPAEPTPAEPNPAAEEGARQDQGNRVRPKRLL